MELFELLMWIGTVGGFGLMLFHMIFYRPICKEEDLGKLGWMGGPWAGPTEPRFWGKKKTRH